jgi:uncharacterized protein
MGNSDDAKWIQLSHKRIWWTKRFLRLMPRRANIHKYPGLKWAKDHARKRMYLWSFRYREVAPALFLGTILSFLPIIGQIPIAVALAFFLRANLPIFVALQFITNWLTVVPLYYICYEIGRWSLKVFDIHVDALSLAELKLFMDNLTNCHWAENGRFLWHVFLVTSLGSLIIGSFVGTVFDMVYRFLSWRTKIIWERVRQIQARMHGEHVKHEAEAQKANEAAASAVRETQVADTPPKTSGGNDASTRVTGQGPNASI